MNAGQLAALIAAGFFAIGVIGCLVVLARLARLISAATTVVTSYSGAADELTRKARAAVERADSQLARTGALAESVDEVAASMTDLAEQVSAVAGTARLISAGLGTPVLRLAALGHGLRYAMRRRPGAVGGAGESGRPGAVGGAGQPARRVAVGGAGQPALPAPRRRRA